jgi:hypothetical protein
MTAFSNQHSAKQDPRSRAIALVQLLSLELISAGCTMWKFHIHPMENLLTAECWFH